MCLARGRLRVQDLSQVMVEVARVILGHEPERDRGAFTDRAGRAEGPGLDVRDHVGEVAVDLLGGPFAGRTRRARVLLVERAELREIGPQGRDHVAGDARRHVLRIAQGAGLGGAGGRVDCQATACQRPSPFFTYTSVYRIWKGAGPIVAESTCTVAVPVRTA